MLITLLVSTCILQAIFLLVLYFVVRKIKIVQECILDTIYYFYVDFILLSLDSEKIEGLMDTTFKGLKYKNSKNIQDNKLYNYCIFRKYVFESIVNAKMKEKNNDTK